MARLRAPRREAPRREAPHRESFLTRPLSWPSRTPLRVRLVAALTLIVMVALFLISLVGVMALRSYQISRVDAQLLSTTSTLAARAADGQPVVDPTQSLPLPLPGAFYIELTSTNGAVLGALRSVTAVEVLPHLALDARAVTLRASAPFDVSAPDGGHWRVVALPVTAGHVSENLTVAVSLSDVDSTTTRLAVVDTVVSLAVLLILGWAGSITVRSNLAPLRSMERTADRVASRVSAHDGSTTSEDLSERVEPLDPRTEAGSLARSFNTMLDALEAAFAERTTALDERTAALADARAAQERLRRFVADASHELRTPLTSIRGFAELHRAGADPDGALVARIETEAARMGTLVEDLLTLARVDQEGAEPALAAPRGRPEEFDALLVALDVVDAARAAHPNRHVELLYDSSPRIEGDPSRLHRVLANLVTNALKYTTGDVDLELGQHGSTVWFEVRDQGPGMRDADAAHVFDRFYRADSSRTRANGGTGLGLSIVDSLVRARGGTVTLLTSPTTGSVFRVEVPAQFPNEGEELLDAVTGGGGAGDDAGGSHSATPDPTTKASELTGTEEPSAGPAPAPALDEDLEYR